MKIGSTCVSVFVKSAGAGVSDVDGTHSLVRFGQRTVSSLGASIWLYYAGEYLSNVAGTQSPVRFGQRTVSAQSAVQVSAKVKPRLMQAEHQMLCCLTERNHKKLILIPD